MIWWDNLINLFSEHEKSASQDPSDDFWWTHLSGSRIINEERLLSIPAAYDAINAVLNPLKTLPLIFFEKISDKEKKRIDNNDIAKSLQQPNNMQNSVEFLDFVGRNLLIYHNAFAEILSDNRGNILGYIPFHPDIVSIEKRPTGFVYKISDGFNIRFITPDRMWHLKAGPFTRDGLMGRGPIVTQTKTLNATLDVIDFGARYFQNNTQLGGVLEIAGELSPEGQRELAKSWQRAHSGANIHKTAVLEQGSKYTPTTVENNKAQFIETRKADDIEIARIWNVPPHRIKSLADATYSNIEQQSIEYIVHSLQPWFRLVETSIKSNLIGMDNNIFAEFNILGLLRGDIKARFEAYSKARNWGWMSVNDIRKLERMNPIEDGDIYLQPLNMQEAGAQDRTETPPDNQQTAETDEKDTKLKLIEGSKND
jgi:HK97 family phage portal protein